MYDDHFFQPIVGRSIRCTGRQYFDKGIVRSLDRRSILLFYVGTMYL